MSLLRDVKRKFGDEAGVQLEDADILAWANDGQQQIVTENKVLREKATQATVVDQFDYTFSLVNVHQITSLHYDGLPLRNLPFAEAENSVISVDPNHEEKGNPMLWWQWGDTITLWPCPNEVKNLSIYYTKTPEPLTGNPAQILECGDKYYPALVNFVLQQAYEMDEDWAASQAKEAQFKNALAEQREEDFLASDLTYPVVIEVD